MRFALILFIVLFLSTYLEGQIKVHKHITTEDGLISNQIVDVYQDSKGYMWFGTFGGVSKWDGINFTNYTKSDGLASVPVVNIIEGLDGTMYFSTYGGGITSLKGDGTLDTLTKVDGLQQNFILGMTILKNGNLCLGNGGTVTEWDNFSFVQDLGDKYDFKKLLLSSISSIIERTNGDLLIGSSSTGFIELSKNGAVYNYNIEHGLNSNWTLDIDSLNDGTLIISNTKGINFFNNDLITPLYLDNKIFTNRVFETTTTQNDIVYSASNSGLLVFTKNKTERITTQQGLLHDELNAIHETDDKNIFIGYDNNGVSYFKPDKIENLTISHGLISNNITAIYQSIDDKILLGSENGLVVLNKDKNLKNYSSLNGYLVNVIHEVSDDHFLFGTKHNGIVIYKNGVKKVLSKTDGLADSIVTSIASGFDNKVYVGTERGVSIIENDKVVGTVSRDVDSIRIGHINRYQFIQSIIRLKDSTLVFGYHGSGINFYKNNFFNSLTPKNGLSDGVINTLFERSNGDLLIGTDQGGLNIYNGERIEIINTSNGLTSNTIKGITEDNLGNIYLSTSKGVNIINYYAGEIFVRTLIASDGLAGNDCNRGAILKDSQGNIWIGTTEGVSKYNPESDTRNTIPPKTHITNFQIFNKDYSINKLLTEKLNHDQNYIKISFIGIDYSAPKKVLYKYKLSGIDKDWVTSNNTSVQYTSLDDSKYTFEVKARNEWGYWSKPTFLSFTIRPAWWETWWFYTIAALSIAGLIAFIASYRYRHLLAVEKVRTKISTDLHDNIGSGLTEITFLSEMVKSQVKENEYANKGLDNISNVSKTLIDDMRDIVWLVNPSKDSLQDLFNRLQDSYQEVLKFSSISLNINGIENLSNIKLPMTYRQHIFLMFKEAINNSIKYSSCKNIKINVEVDNNTLIVNLRDDGVGFDMSNTKFGNGINNIKKRAKLVNGNVIVESSPGNGTFIKFSGKFSKFRFMEI